MTEGEKDYPSVTCGDSSPDKGSLPAALQKRRKIYESNPSYTTLTAINRFYLAIHNLGKE